MKVGDVVKLKSDSPEMTIELIQDDKKIITCVWFGDDGNFDSRNFHEETLINISEIKDQS